MYATTGQVVSRASCTAVKSLGALLSYGPYGWSLDMSSQLETDLEAQGATSAAPVDLFELLLLARRYAC